MIYTFRCGPWEEALSDSTFGAIICRENQTHLVLREDMDRGYRKPGYYYGVSSWSWFNAL